MKSFGVCFLVVVAAAVAQCRHVGEVSCSDNATCIGNMADRIYRSIAENKPVNILGLATIEPMERAEEARATEGPIARFFNTHSVKVDFGQIGVRVKRAMRKDASIEVEVEDNKALEEGRRRGKRIIRMFLPIMLGFKAASTLIVAVAAVALLTFKAFLASKLALLVTGGMLVKKLMENFGGGLGFSQPQPYMYQNYPIDFPTAGAQPGYSMPGNAFGGSQEGIYGLTGLGTHQHEMLQQAGSPADTAGQYSQPIISGIANPNITSKFVPAAGKRWDGLKRKPMYYEHSGDNDSGYQEYDRYEKFL